MTFDHGSPWFCGRELATPPPADEGDIAGEAASELGPIGGGRGGQFWGVVDSRQEIDESGV